MTTGHEQRFRALFADEARARLQRLTSGALQLEEAVGDTGPVVDAMFREAHTLKGGAAVVGLTAVQGVAHALEDRLDRLRDRGPGDVPGDVVRGEVDALLAGIDGLAELIAAGAAGTDRHDLAEDLEAGLRAGPASPPRPAETRPPQPPPPPPQPLADQAEAAPAGTATMADAAAGAESMRIPVQRLDELVRLVTESVAASLRVGAELGAELGRDPSFLPAYHRLTRLLSDLQERAMRARMVPVAGIAEPLRRAVRDAGRSLGHRVRFEITGEDTELDRGVLEALTDPLLHLVRNAVAHGLEDVAQREAAGKRAEGTVRLHALQVGQEVVLSVSDDGRGVDVEAVRAAATARGVNAEGLDDEQSLALVYERGLSTTGEVDELSGRGVGLDVVREALTAVRGRVELRSSPGQGTEFRLVVPITLAVVRCLLCEAGGVAYALPLHAVATVLDLAGTPTMTSDGGPAVWHDGRPVPLASLADVLGLPAPGPDGPRTAGKVVVVSGPVHRHALSVDTLLGQREVVVKGLGDVLPALPVLMGASVEASGVVLPVLDPAGVVERARVGGGGHAGAAAVVAAAPDARPQGEGSARRRTVLVVDDALTIRELQRSILDRAGFRVITATDGVDGLRRLDGEPDVDLVVTDVEMPNMDGLSLTREIRRHPRYAQVPVVVLTSRGDAHDRRQGLEAGADAYIVKRDFSAADLLSTVDRLVGGLR